MNYLLWWALYLRNPGRRSEESARRLARVTFGIAMLSGVLFAPGVWLWLSTAYRSQVHGWEMAVLVGGTIGIIGPVIATKIQDKAESTTLPDLSEIGKKRP